MSGSNIVADTSLLVNFFNGIDAAMKVLKNQQIWISTITEIELLSFGSLTMADIQLIGRPGWSYAPPAGFYPGRPGWSYGQPT